MLCTARHRSAFGVALFSLAGCGESAPTGPASAGAAASYNAPIAAAPTAPVEMRVTLNAGLLSGSWSDTSAVVTRFLFERSADGGSTWSLVDTIQASQYGGRYLGGWTDYYFRQQEKQTCYRAIAINAAGRSAPSGVDCGVIPAAPTGLTATLVDWHTVDLAWQDNSSIEGGYAVVRADGHPDLWGGDVVIAYLPPGTTSFHDDDVIGSTWWDVAYRVRAVAPGHDWWDGAYNFSNRVSMFVPLPPEEEQAP